MKLTLLLVGLLVFFWFRGFPRTRVGYRLLLGLFAALSMAIGVDWAVHYVVGAYYFSDQHPWMLLIFSAIGVMGFAAFLGEIVTLRRFKAAKERRRTAADPTAQAAAADLER